MPSSNYSLFHMKTILLGNLFWKPFYYEAFLMQFYVLRDARDGRLEQERKRHIVDDNWIGKTTFSTTSLFKCNMLKR